jgi:ubiquinone/menaquinone biosynthesis C-methylase UbiE
MQTKKFLDPEAVLFRTGLTRGSTVVDFGAGSGFFALSSAKIAGNDGHVYVVDLLETALAHVNAEARLKNLRNIQTIRADLEKGEVTQIPAGTADLVIIANLLHQVKDHKKIMHEAYRVLKTSGKLLVVDWNEAPVAIGPVHTDRVAEEDVKSQATKASLKFNGSIDTDTYHYGLIFVK